MNDYTRNNSTSSDTPQLAAAKFIESCLGARVMPGVGLLLSNLYANRY